MKIIGGHNYFIYLTTNFTHSVLYTGVTNNLGVRLHQHYQDSISAKQHFTGKYNAYHLVHYERFQFIEQAIRREKEIKGWSRKKKNSLIEMNNPNWDFLNAEVA